jgi:hypothetical protein
MKLLFLLVKDLERKPKSGANGFIADMLPAFDYVESHLEEQLEEFNSQTYIGESGVIVRTILHTNTLNTQAKLLKYKRKNVLPVLFAACVIVPWRKWAYFEENITLDELQVAKNLVQDLWTTKYVLIPAGASIINKDRGGRSTSEVLKVRISESLKTKLYLQD